MGKKNQPGYSGTDGMQTVTNEPNLQTNHITCTLKRGGGKDCFDHILRLKTERTVHVCAQRHTHKR